MLDRLTQSLADQDGRALIAAAESLRYYAGEGEQVIPRGVLVGSIATPTADAGRSGPPAEIRLRIDALVTELNISIGEARAPGTSGGRPEKQ
ncbi:hypothetical protein I6A60_26710 [Frankia sp. AgB1.9]|uniref:hypothetical protein n=1 Tax=Frankia sp. AgB1.9 TaxID=1836968 RepID=UPI0019324880|nr:hypothetical protein [Frankia sp. AgB1.9]MBL7488599.1 hypothetical protein [Frankia sp. AgW1.1]MBL7551423.1 hypothetical protein [Frankia sp. AgB1.9]MBL7622676.1 hypothetical protein [Frankia sp. AgB1.8]